MKLESMGSQDIRAGIAKSISTTLEIIGVSF